MQPIKISREHNQALADARKVIEQKMISMEEDMYALEQPLPSGRR